MLLPKPYYVVSLYFYNKRNISLCSVCVLPAWIHSGPCSWSSDVLSVVHGPRLICLFTVKVILWEGTWGSPLHTQFWSVCDVGHPDILLYFDIVLSYIHCVLCDICFYSISLSWFFFNVYLFVIWNMCMESPPSIIWVASPCTHLHAP